MNATEALKRRVAIMVRATEKQWALKRSDGLRTRVWQFLCDIGPLLVAAATPPARQAAELLDRLHGLPEDALMLSFSSQLYEDICAYLQSSQQVPDWEPVPDDWDSSLSPGYPLCKERIAYLQGGLVQEGREEVARLLALVPLEPPAPTERTAELLRRLDKEHQRQWMTVSGDIRVTDLLRDIRPILQAAADPQLQWCHTLEADIGGHVQWHCVGDGSDLWFEVGRCHVCGMDLPVLPDIDPEAEEDRTVGKTLREEVSAHIMGCPCQLCVWCDAIRLAPQGQEQPAPVLPDIDPEAEEDRTVGAMAGLIASEHAANGHDPDLCAVCDTIGGIRERAGLVGQEEAVPEPSFEAQLAELGAKGEMSEEGDAPRWTVRCGNNAGAFFGDDEAERARALAFAAENPYKSPEQILRDVLPKYGGRLIPNEGQGGEWLVQAENGMISGYPSRSTAIAIAFCMVHRNPAPEPTFEEQLAAVGAKCRYSVGTAEAPRPQTVVVTAENGKIAEYYVRHQLAEALAFARENRNPAPQWPLKLDKDADEWQPPETVHDVLNYLRSRNYSLITDGEAVLDALQECSRQVHAHEEANDADASATWDLPHDDRVPPPLLS